MGNTGFGFGLMIWDYGCGYEAKVYDAFKDPSDVPL